MALAEENQHAPEHLLPPGFRKTLENLPLGHTSIRAGRKILEFLRKVRDPVQQRVWISRYLLPLRNAVLLNRPLEVSIDGTRVLMEPRGTIAAAIWSGARCESHEVSFIVSMLEPGMVFFDVGANAGVFTLSAAKKIGGQVFAFEPCSSTSELLKQNLRLNRITDVHVERIALTDSVGTGVLQVNVAGRDGLNTLGQATHPDSQVIGQEEVGLTTVDVFIEERNVPRVDVMKVDIEGAELLMFRGARKLLARADAPVILFEGFGFLTRGFGYHPVEILWLLESFGYSLFTLNSQTGAVAELKSDYNYDSMVIAAKPGNSAFEKWRARIK